MHYRLKTRLKLQKASDEKEVQKGIYFLEPPTGRRTSHNYLNMFLLVTADEVIAAQRERISSNWREWRQWK